MKVLSYVYSHVISLNRLYDYFFMVIYFRIDVSA